MLRRGARWPIWTPRSAQSDEPASFVNRLVNAFFCECEHMRAWILEAGVPKPEVSLLVDDTSGSEPLRIANAVCNTHKHWKRSAGVEARTGRTVLGPSGAQVAIEVDWGKPSARRVDTLTLADD